MYLFLDTTEKDFLRLAIFDENGIMVKKKKIKKQTRKIKNILPLINSSLKNLDINPCFLRGILTVVGPGSFSAVRSGVVIANAFRLACDISLIGIVVQEGYVVEEVIQKNLSKMNQWSKRKNFLLKPFYAKEPNVTTVS